MITTWSDSRSASSMKCVVRITLTPSARSARIRSQVACLACGSMPAVGSSRKTSSGRPITAAASDSRCCCPPDSRLYGVRFGFAEADDVKEPRRVVWFHMKPAEQS